MRGRTREKKCRESGIIFNYCWFFRDMYGFCKWRMLLFAAYVVSKIGLEYTAVYVPRVMILLVSGGTAVPEVFAVLALFGILIAAFQTMQECGYWKGHLLCLKYRHVLQEKVLHKLCRLPYYHLEDPKCREMVDRAKEMYDRWDRDVHPCVFTALRFFIQLVRILVSSVVLSTLHPVIIAALAGSAWLQYKAGQYSVEWRKNHRDFWQPLEMKIYYIVSRVRDFTYAKDIRLYHAASWLMPKYGRLMKERFSWCRKELRMQVVANGIIRTAAALGQAVVYLFLIRGVVVREISPEDFVLYVGLALSMSGALGRLAVLLRNLKDNSVSIADYRKLLQFAESREERKALPDGEKERCREKKAAPSITFSHVSFAYPGDRKRVLDDVSFTIRSGERLAVVGVNGAGKSTLIKLLCRLYEPTQGMLLIDGSPAAEWKLEAYYGMFSAVFQELDAAPATIMENVTCHAAQEEDRERVKECLMQAGLWKLVEQLPYGMDTYLHKELFSEGVNLSGGETQKLLLARAIYKQAPVLILDEPTAALDAIAENQLYLRYNSLTRGRTGIYISHRLSSTRFCDRILMLEGGRIVEEGSHEELMRKKGAYYRLYQVQSHYYQKDREGGFDSLLDPSWEVSSYVSG